MDFGEPWYEDDSGCARNKTHEKVNSWSVLSMRAVECVNALAGENPEKVKLWKELHIAIKEYFRADTSKEMWSWNSKVKEIINKLDALDAGKE